MEMEKNQLIAVCGLNCRECQIFQASDNLEIAKAIADWFKKERDIEVKIEDTGIGMDEETKKHALEPFFSTKKKASGLGLSQVHGIVKQHRGIMKLESQPSQGTKVIIYLPEYETKEKNENSSGYKYFC